MGIFTTIILLAMALAFLSINKRIYQPAFLFCLLFGSILFFESFHLYDMYKSQTKTYLIILLGAISFCIGTVFMSRTKIRLRTKNDIGSYNYSIKYKLYTYLLIFSIMMSLYPAVNNLIHISQSGLDFSTIRADFGTYYNSNILNLIYNYVVNPFINACLPITAVSIFINIEKEKKRKLFILTAVLIILSIFMNAGRGILLYFLVMVFFAYKIESDNAKFDLEKVKKKKRYKRIFIVIFILAVWGYIAITKLRGGSTSSSFLKQIYIYICGCVPHLDYRINQIQSANVCLYGTGGFHGLFQFVFTMFENFGLMKYPNFMLLSDTWYTNSLSYVSIGPNTSFNAYATLFYNCFLDGGLLAIIIEMFVYGCLCGAMYRRVISNPHNERDKLVFIYLLYGVCFSFVRFQFTLHSHWIAIIMLILLTRKTVVYS